MLPSICFATGSLRKSRAKAAGTSSSSGRVRLTIPSSTTGPMSPEHTTALQRSAVPFSLAFSRRALLPAIVGYRALLVGDWSRLKDPANWAITQDDLGSALCALGELTGDPRRLQEAVAAHRSALEVRTKETAPAEWAMTQGELGLALERLGRLVGERHKLEEAVTAYHRALEVFTLEDMPTDWAATQNNLSNTH